MSEMLSNYLFLMLKNTSMWYCRSNPRDVMIPPENGVDMVNYASCICRGKDEHVHRPCRSQPTQMFDIQTLTRIKSIVSSNHYTAFFKLRSRTT